MSTTETQVALIVHGPTGLTVDHAAVDAMYANIHSQIAAFVYDLTTESGRAKAASLAYGIAKKRTAIEADKKKLKEGLLAQGRAIDGAWNEIKEKLESLQEEARKPLTDWETAEASRIASCSNTIGMLEQAPHILATDTSETVAALLKAVEETVIDPAVFQELEAAANNAKTFATLSLRAAVASLEQKEADALELARLRAESEARAAADRKAVEEVELLRQLHQTKERERIRIEEQAEAKRVAEEQAAAREKAAAAKAAQEAEERVKAALEAKHQAELEAQKKERLEAERLVQQEAARVEAAHRKELEEARRIANEADARERQARQKQMQDEADAATKAAADKKLAANRKHRLAIMATAEAAIIAHATNGLAEISPAAARSIVQAIVDGKIPMCTLRFS